MSDALDLLRSRWATIAFAFIILCGAAVPVFERVSHLSYQAVSKVLLVSESPARDPSVISDDLPSIATGTTVLDRVRKQLHLATSSDALRKSLTAKIGMHSVLLNIAATDRDPERAVTVANAVAQTTTDYYGEISGHRYDAINSGLRGQLDAARKRLASIDESSRALAVGNPIVASDKALDVLTAQLSDLQSQRAQAYAGLVSDQAIGAAQDARSPDVKAIAETETLKNDARFTAARDLYVKNANALDSMRAQYTDKYPGVAELSKQVDIDRESMDTVRREVLARGVSGSPSYAAMLLDQRKATGATDGDKARVSALDAQIAKASSQLGNYVGDWTSLQSLRDQHDAAESAVQTLAQRLGGDEANAAEANSLGSLVVVDRAVRAQPQLTRTIGVIAALALAVLCGAIAAGLAADLLDPHLRTRRRIERLYGHPVVGSVSR